MYWTLQHTMKSQWITNIILVMQSNTINIMIYLTYSEWPDVLHCAKKRQNLLMDCATRLCEMILSQDFVPKDFAQRLCQKILCDKVLRHLSGEWASTDDICSALYTSHVCNEAVWKQYGYAGIPENCNGGPVRIAVVVQWLFGGGTDPCRTLSWYSAYIQLILQWTSTVVRIML